MAAEIASRNITVNAVAPGFIDTPMTDAAFRSVKEALNARIPLGRMGQTRDVAAAIVFLASDEAAYITGQCSMSMAACTWVSLSGNRKVTAAKAAL